jgi:hypothetical protein
MTYIINDRFRIAHCGSKIEHDIFEICDHFLPAVAYLRTVQIALNDRLAPAVRSVLNARVI